MVKTTEVTGPLKDLLYKTFTSSWRPGYVKVLPSGVVLPDAYLNYADQILNAQVRDDDVWVLAFPKTGTTWTQEMCWLLMHNFDYEAAKRLGNERSPQIELSVLLDFAKMPRMENEPNIVRENRLKGSVNVVDSTPSPRLIKSHLHWALLPKEIAEKKPKIVTTIRDPRDVCVSYYHHVKLIEGYTGTLEEFCELFIADMLPLTPYSEVILEMWKRRDEPNILILFYDELKKDLPKEIRRVAAFLGHSVSDEDIEKLSKHLSFEEMKKNPAISGGEELDAFRKTMDMPEGLAITRKGKSGGWKDEMSPMMQKKFQEYLNRFKGTGLPYQ